MSQFIFDNIRDMGLIRDIDIILYYNNRVDPEHCLKICKGEDDCVSVLFDSGFFDRSEFEKELIEYYEAKYKNNPQLAISVIKDYLNNKEYYNNPDNLNI